MMNSKSVSNHYKNQRYKREKFIKRYLHDDGQIIDGFIIDRGHFKGAEVHSLTDKGVIIIHNYNTGVLVTKLIAKPEQIMRYYENTGREKPPEYKHILNVAQWHESLCYNYA